MKSLLRLGILALIAAMVLTPSLSGTAVKAQGAGAPCYGLPDADCKLFQDAFGSDTMAKLTSFVMDYDLSVVTKGSPSGDVTVKVNGTGPFAVDMKAMQSTDSSNPMAALNGFQVGNVIKASVTGAGAGGDQSGTFEFRIVGGQLYFMGDKATQGKWMSVALADAAKMAQTQGAAMGGGSGGASGAGAAALQDPDVQAALAAIPNIPGFIKGAAKDGPDVDGVKTRQITYNFDLVALISAKEIRPAIKALSKQNGAAGVTDAQLDQMMPILTAALKNSTVSVTWLIGADKVFRGFGFNIAINLDATTVAMLGSMGGSSSGAGAATGPVSANIDFLVKLSKVGQPATVEAPKDATPMNLGGSK